MLQYSITIGYVSARIMYWMWCWSLATVAGAIPLRNPGSKDIRMVGVTDPQTGLQFFELSHEWGHGVPSMPGSLSSVRGASGVPERGGLR